MTTLAAYLIELAASLHDPCGRNRDLFFLVCQNEVYGAVCGEIPRGHRMTCSGLCGQACAKEIRDYCRD